MSKLLKENNVDDFYLTDDKYITHERAFEIWQYRHKNRDHFLIKHLYNPHHLFFIQLEVDEVFWTKDFDYYLDHGDFKDGWNIEGVNENYCDYMNGIKKRP